MNRKARRLARQIGTVEVAPGVFKHARKCTAAENAAGAKISRQKTSILRRCAELTERLEPLLPAFGPVPEWLSGFTLRLLTTHGLSVSTGASLADLQQWRDDLERWLDELQPSPLQM